jgi:hypothetical protein
LKEKTTIFLKDSQVTERKSVILSDAERRNLRRKLKESVGVAQDVLNPRNQLARLVERSTTKMKHVAADATQVAKKNAPLIGAVGLGAILFAARRPISNWLSKLRKSKTPNTPDGD